MRKGFTLIELLAVIVILAIIALIATPLILGVIDKAKKGAFKDSAYGIIKAAELSYTQDVLRGNEEQIIYTYANGSETSEPSGKALNYKGEKPKNGTIVINREGKVAIAIHNGGYCAEKGFDNSDITLTNKAVEDCNLRIGNPIILDTLSSDQTKVTLSITVGGLVVRTQYSIDGGSLQDYTGPFDIMKNDVVIYVEAEDIIGNTSNTTYVTSGIFNPSYDVTKGVNAPLLTAGMTPIKWSGTDWIDTTEDDIDWYDYANKKWANAQTADGSHWVWIPRYIYKISNGWHSSNTGTIDVKFSKLTDDTLDGTITLDTDTTANASNNKWTNHPAFTFGEDELTGIWVAKFEASVADTTDPCYTSRNTTNCNIPTLVPKIVPNVKAWTYIDVNNKFMVSRNMETNTTYGWGTTGKNIDTHLMKNIEWGAVAYLARSTYGKNAEVWINNCDNNNYYEYITGYGGTGASAAEVNTCTYDYTTSNGQQASTTGNVYGVYGMSGGVGEVVAAYIDNSAASTYGDILINADSKYKDIYTKATSDSMDTNYPLTINKKGDAVYETSDDGSSDAGWYSDGAWTPYGSVGWFYRGGASSDRTRAGIFEFEYSSGANNQANDGFRPVLVVGANL